MLNRVQLIALDHNFRIYVRSVLEQPPTMVSVLPGEVFLFSSPHKVISCTPLWKQHGEVRQVHRQLSFTSHLLQSGVYFL